MSEFYAGKIAYVGPQGEIGREWFEMVPFVGGGGRTVRAFCEMDEVGISRDVTMALDERSRPIDGYVRVVNQGKVSGSTLFMVEPGRVELEGRTQDHGRVSQRKPVPGMLPYLGLHPLVGDALVAPVRGTDAPGEFRTVHGLTNSLSWPIVGLPTGPCRAAASRGVPAPARPLRPPPSNGCVQWPDSVRRAVWAQSSRRDLDACHKTQPRTPTAWPFPSVPAPVEHNG